MERSDVFFRWKSRNLPILLVLLCTMGHVSCTTRTICRERDKIVSTMNFIESYLTKAKALLPKINEEYISSNKSHCRGVSHEFLDIAINLTADTKKYNRNCLRSRQRIRQKSDPADCADLLAKPNYESGVYRIWPRTANNPIHVYCHVEDGGGFTVIQRRRNYSVPLDFYRDWRSYAAGFGNLSREFWIGNENLHLLTSQDDYSLWVDMADRDGNFGWAQYKHFYVGDRLSNFRLNVSGFNGDAGDSLTKHNGMMFSTKDRNNDISEGNCAQNYKSGWWFFNCYHCNLNGELDPNSVEKHTARWNTWRTEYGLSALVMMIRRSSFGSVVKPKPS